MPARQGDDGRSGILEADGAVGLDVDLERAVVLALGGVGIGIGILAWLMSLEADAVVCRKTVEV